MNGGIDMNNRLGQPVQVNNQPVDLGDWGELAVPANVQPQDGPGGQARVNGRESLGNAQVEDLAADLRRQVPARHSLWKAFKGGWNTACRGLMKFCHVVHSAFTRAPEKKHRRDYENAMQTRIGERQGVDIRIGDANADVHALSNGENVRDADVVTYSPREIGAAMGLSGQAHVVPFSDAEVRQIESGDFHLNDIKQDPNLQDCWFLSSLASVLSFKGADYLQSLITIPQEGNGNADFALVKLGNDTYKVPFGDVVGKGREKGTSSSKAWVRLLETAMQMHMVNLSQKGVTSATGIKVDMNGGAPDLALGALLGLENVRREGGLLLHSTHVAMIHPQEPATLNERVTRITNALRNNTPVVLASPDKEVLQTVKYGFSPGHAVSVQDVEWKGGRCFLHILDPYSRSVVLDADILMNGATVYIGAANA